MISLVQPIETPTITAYYSQNRSGVLYGQDSASPALKRIGLIIVRQHSIMTALQLREVEDQWIRKHLDIVGLRLVMELRGVSCLDLEECPAPK